VGTSSNTGGTTSQSRCSSPLILTTTNAFPRRLRTITQVFLGPFSQRWPQTVPSVASYEPDTTWDKPDLWEPTALPRVQQETSIHDLVLPKLTPPAVCKSSPSSLCKNTTYHYVRQLNNFLDNSYERLLPKRTSVPETPLERQARMQPSI
jgi:hypothetical protein